MRMSCCSWTRCNSRRTAGRRTGCRSCRWSKSLRRHYRSTNRHSCSRHTPRAVLLAARVATAVLGAGLSLLRAAASASAAGIHAVAVRVACTAGGAVIVVGHAGVVAGITVLTARALIIVAVGRALDTGIVNAVRFSAGAIARSRRGALNARVCRGVAHWGRQAALLADGVVRALDALAVGSALVSRRCPGARIVAVAPLAGAAHAALTPGTLACILALRAGHSTRYGPAATAASRAEIGAGSAAAHIIPVVEPGHERVLLRLRDTGVRRAAARGAGLRCGYLLEAIRAVGRAASFDVAGVARGLRIDGLLDEAHHAPG